MVNSENFAPASDDYNNIYIVIGGINCKHNAFNHLINVKGLGLCSFFFQNRTCQRIKLQCIMTLINFLYLKIADPSKLSLFSLHIGTFSAPFMWPCCALCALS